MTRTLTKKELAQGWVPCACHKFAFVFRQELADNLPVEAATWDKDCGLYLVPIHEVRTAVASMRARRGKK